MLARHSWLSGCAHSALAATMLRTELILPMFARANTSPSPGLEISIALASQLSNPLAISSLRCPQFNQPRISGVFWHQCGLQLTREPSTLDALDASLAGANRMYEVRNCGGLMSAISTKRIYRTAHPLSAVGCKADMLAGVAIASHLI